MLKRHELKHSGTEERLFGCDVCGLKLKSESSIKSHKLIIHSSERNFVCQQCDQKFVFSRLLERHVKVVHEGETQYSCKLCLENFRYMRQVNYKRYLKFNASFKRFLYFSTNAICCKSIILQKFIFVTFVICGLRY